MRESRNWPRLTCPICENEFSPYKHSHRRLCCSDACRRIYDEARYVVKRVLTPTEAAYLAGIVDGEGTLSVWKEKRPANVAGVRYKCTFTIAQASWEFLERMREMTGNGTVQKSNAGWKPHHKQVYTLTFKSHATQWVLPQILPYLIRKRRQGELVMQFYKTLTTRRQGIAGREAIYEECHELNRRGLRPGETD